MWPNNYNNPYKHQSQAQIHLRLYPCPLDLTTNPQHTRTKYYYPLILYEFDRPKISSIIPWILYPCLFVHFLTCYLFISSLIDCPNPKYIQIIVSSILTSFHPLCDVHREYQVIKCNTNWWNNAHVILTQNIYVTAMPHISLTL